MSLVRKTFELDGITFECCAVVDPNNQIYCKFKELAYFLGYQSDPYRASSLIKSKWKLYWRDLKERVTTDVQFPDLTFFVSEPGIYSLLFRSRKFEARHFTDYVFEVVLPALRQAGLSAQGLVEGLRETLSEKEKALTETREKLEKMHEELEEKDKLLSETRQALEEVNRMLSETRGECAEKEKAADTILTETRKELLEKNRMLENEMQQKRQLQNDMRVVKRRVAVTPKSRSVLHALCVFQNGNIYKVIRAQKRGLKKSMKRIPREFTLVYSNLNVPNPFHVMNRLKETLPKFAFKYNTITSELDVVSLIRQFTENEQ